MLIVAAKSRSFALIFHFILSFPPTKLKTLLCCALTSTFQQLLQNEVCCAGLKTCHLECNHTFLLFEAGVHCGLSERLWLQEKKKTLKRPTGLWEIMCDDRESTAYLWWDGERHRATGDMLSAARGLKNSCNASIFQMCCLHVCTCTESS